MDTTKTITHIGLCAGYGGIELGLKRVITSMRSVALCEIEAFAIANLVAKMEAGLMEPAPIWTDLKTFPWEEFRDRVDILTGGYPCQPFSAAGKRLGTDDPRHLWPFIASGIRILRPRMCFFENVEGHISLGLSTVISDLEELGYKVSWGIFSASEVGAPHQRKRVFILADRSSEGFPRHRGLEQIGLSQGWEVEKGCSSESGGLGSTGILWPSRPGEPQHAWEPPRVVANSNNQHGYGSQRGWDSETHCFSSQHREKEHTRREFVGTDAEALENSKFVGRGGRSYGDAGWLCGEIQTAGSCGGCAETMGNATSQRSHRGTQNGLGLQPEVLGEGHEAMGNAEIVRAQGAWAEQQTAGSMQSSAMGNADHGRLASGLNSRSGTEADRGGQGDIEQAESGQAQFSLGRDAYEPFIGMDLSELSGLSHQELAEIREWMVASDNRTDELRLLGNGVVPATATRAFLILLEDIINK